MGVKWCYRHRETFPEEGVCPQCEPNLFLVYKGPIHSRPCGRGVVLDELGDSFDSEGVLPDGEYVAEIRVWKKGREDGKL